MHRFRLPPLVTLAALLLAAPAPAQQSAERSARAAAAAPAYPLDSLAPRIDALFAQWSAPTSPGAALAVIRDGRVAYAKGYGSANLEYGIPITPSSVFHIASVSKHFTDFAIHLLAAEGRLSLDDDVRKYISELHDFAKTYGRPVTIRQLIHHTSGVRDQWELLAMAGWRLDDVITQEQILKTVTRQRELNFPPGNEHLYSNGGYSLLAEVVERVSGKSFADFTRERIFEPLGMTRTHFHDDHERIVPGRAYSYRPGPRNGWRNAPLNYANVGATSLFTTVEDMAKWDANWLEPKVGTRALLDGMLVRGKLTSGREIPYAHGLSHGRYRGLATISHGGADAGYRTIYLRFPEQRTAIVVFSNLATFNPGRLAQQVADVVLAPALGPLADTTSRRAGMDDRNRPVVPVAPKVGLYYAPDGETRRVTLEGGTLRFRGAELLPRDSATFDVIGGPPGATVRFDGPPEGTPTRLVEMVPGDSARSFARAPGIPAAVLGEYAGTYTSDELVTQYTLTMRGDTLLARHARHPDITLAPVARDLLNGNAWFFSTLRFERDGAGKVTGFRVTGGRVRNLLFRRTGS